MYISTTEKQFPLNINTGVWEQKKKGKLSL
jgi:hypothetical protein